MDTARIAALLEPFVEKTLSPFQLDQVSTYIDLLKRWNARINLTAIRKEEEIVARHFGESFFLAAKIAPEGAPSKLGLGGRVLDIGSGAGFPALPLKIWSPQIHLTLIESNHKKAAFLHEVARALTLTNINIITARAETVAQSQSPPQAEVVTLRAVERMVTILPQAITFLALHGTLALLIGASQLPTLTQTVPIKWQPPIHIPQSHSRVLSIGIHS